MRLHAVCFYRSKSDEWTEKWRGSDYRARNLVQAIKGGDFKGYSEFKTVAGVVHRVDSTPNGREVAMAVASWGLAKKIREAGYENACLIPVPSSDHVDPCAEFTGSRLAQAIAQKDEGFSVRPALFFNEVMVKSSAGGGRNSNAIQANLRATACDGIANAVLIDDVCTSGAHLKASARFLARRGITVTDAFVIARTVWEKPDNMFRVAVEEFDI